MNDRRQEILANSCLLTMVMFGVAVTILIVALAVNLL